MKKRISYGIATLLVAALMSGCGKVPQTNIDQANAAIDSAKAIGAEMYVPEAYAALQDSMKSAMLLIEGQSSKLMKNYGEAKEKLALITTQAGDVKMKTETRKEELKAEIQSMISEVKAVLASNKELVTKAPKGKEGTAALQAIKNELSVIETSVAEAESQLESGDLLGAQSKLGAAREKVYSISTELTEVIAKYNKAKR